MPTPDDKAYEAESAWLRMEPRDAKAYPRVRTELTNYGLARNLLAMRWLGLVIAIMRIFVQGRWSRCR
jgi:hypothetical protein